MPIRRLRTLTILCTLLASRAAFAGDPAAGRRAFKAAETHYSIGEFAKALEGYRTAFKVDPHPEFLFNIGQCLRKLGRYREALFHYRQYLLKKPTAKNVGDVKKLIEMCEQHLADEADRKKADRKKADRKKADRKKVAKRHEQPRDGAPSTGSRVLLWGGVGLSAALLVTSAITGGVALSKSNEYNDGATSLSRRRELQDSGVPLRTVHYVTLATGSAAAVATLLYYFLAYRNQREAPSTRVGVVSDGRGAQLVLGGRF